MAMTASDEPEPQKTYESSDSEDELAQDDWQWIYEEAESVGHDDTANPKKRKAAQVFAKASHARVVGARKGDVELRVGDCALLKAARNEQWVALIAEFLEDEVEGEKEAKFMWFTSPKEIRNKMKRRTDAMSVRNCALL